MMMIMNEKLEQQGVADLSGRAVEGFHFDLDHLIMMITMHFGRYDHHDCSRFILISTMIMMKFRTECKHIEALRRISFGHAQSSLDDTHMLSLSL